jgi:hypothetical protein
VVASKLIDFYSRKISGKDFGCY